MCAEEEKVSSVSVVGEVVVPNYAQTLIQYSNAYGQLISAMNYATDWAAVERQTWWRLRRALRPHRAPVARVRRRTVCARWCRVRGDTCVMPPPSAWHAATSADEEEAAEYQYNGEETDSETEETSVRPTRDGQPYSGASSQTHHSPLPTCNGHDGVTASGEEEEELESDFFAAVAVLSTRLTRPRMTVRLLRLLVYGAVQTCSSRCIAGAVFAWRRLLANERDLFTVPLLRHVLDALAWTHREGFGLFDGARPQPAEEVQTGRAHLRRSANSGGSTWSPNDTGGFLASPMTELYAADYASHSPHTILFAFLADAYVDAAVPVAHASVVHGLLYEMALTMVRDGRRWSLKDSSFAETMRAVVLLLHVAARLDGQAELCAEEESSTGGGRGGGGGDGSRDGGGVVVSPRLVSRLRGLIYAVLLQWFTKSPPSWYYAADPSLGEAQMPVLAALETLLEREEERVWCRGREPRTHPGAATRRCRRACLLALLRVCVRHEAVRLRILHNPRRPHGGGSDDAYAALLRAGEAPARVRACAQCCPACGGVKHHVSAQGWRTRRGSGSPVRAHTPPEDVYETAAKRWRVAWCGRRARRNEVRWTVLLTTAAQHRAAVVTALATRFAAVPTVRRVASALIQAAPAHFAHLPAAVDGYLTPATLAAQAPALGLFVRAAMVQALRLLHVHYRRCPEVMVYATRSLMSRPSAALVFYMPQLLQILAHEDAGAEEAVSGEAARWITVAGAADDAGARSRQPTPTPTPTHATGGCMGPFCDA